MHWRLATLLSAVLVTVISPTSARADDQGILRIATTLLPRASQSAFVAAGGRGGATAVQDQYDAARDIQEALLAQAPASPTCQLLAGGLAAFAKAEVGQAEAFDRQSATGVAQAGATASRALAGLAKAQAACTPTPDGGAPGVAPSPIDDPGSFEAFFGAVRSRAPVGATDATITIDGRRLGQAEVQDGWLRTRVSGKPAHGRLEVTFTTSSGTVVGRSVAESVWLLPKSGSVAALATKRDAMLSGELARSATSFAGISAIYTLDLTTGTEASSNSEARFSAASTVKLGVLAAALARFGPRPEQNPAFYDLESLAAWSSNLAANRLLVSIGGSSARGAAIAQSELHRLGATTSTYPGNYIAGTRDPTRNPPATSSRVTTARDLGTALATLHRAATGDARARRSSGLSVHEARVALRLLLGSQPVGENLGLIRSALGPSLPVAQKQGWLDNTRITAAIVYVPAGPRVVVICAFGDALTLSSGQRLGEAVVSTLHLR